MLTRWPIGQELKLLLQSAGITPPDTLDYDGIIAQGIEDFEHDTKWFPFWSTGSDETRVYDPPSGQYLLDLQGGLLSLTSLSVNGTSLTSGTDFFLLPNNASNKGKPYTHIKFRVIIHSLPQSLSITGKWGYCPSTGLLQGAYNAVLYRAATLVLEPIALAVTGGMTEIKLGDDEFTYTNKGNSPYTNLLVQWDKQYQEVLSRYHRDTIA